MPNLHIVQKSDTERTEGAAGQVQSADYPALPPTWLMQLQACDRSRPAAAALCGRLYTTRPDGHATRSLERAVAVAPPTLPPALSNSRGDLAGDTARNRLALSARVKGAGS